MFKNNKIIILTLRIIFIVFVVSVNSYVVIKILNKSMYTNLIIEPGNFNESFVSGNSLIIMITILFYSIFGTIIVAILITNIIFGLIAYANYIKVIERNEYITFSELYTITSPKELLSFLDISIGSITLLVFSVIFSLIIIQYITLKISRKFDFKFNNIPRILLFSLSLMILIVVYFYPNTYNQYILKFETANTHNWNPLDRAKKDGFLPTFVHSIKPDYMEIPENYTKDKIEQISSKYKDIAKEKNTKRTNSLNDSQTLLYLSESLVDPKQIPELLLNESPIPFISETRDDNIGGSIYSQYIGGGTANIEWSVLTSFSLEVFNNPLTITPFSDFYIQSKNNSSVLNYFDNKKVAIHPYTAHLYKRQTVYNKMEFDDFLYLNNGIKYTEKLGSHHRVSDESLNKDILRVVNENNVGLIHILSMQNHTPYDGEIHDMEYIPNININTYPEEKQKELFNYFQGIKASDESIKKLISELNKSNKDINIIFYGDHAPKLYRELEENFNEIVHEAPWFIYMNKERNHKKIEFDGISPIFLVPILLKEGNYKITPFHSLLEELLNNEVKRIGKNFIVTDNGKINDENLNEDISALVSDYRIVMYDSLFGHHWLTDEFFSINK